MFLVGNSLNNSFFRNLIERSDRAELEEIVLAIAYVKTLDDVFGLATRRKVPLTLYTLLDRSGFLSARVLNRFVENSPATWRLFLTKDHYHPKIAWFKGVGVYIGSANATNGGWYSNLECGVWFDQADIDGLAWHDQLEGMLGFIRGRSLAASSEHSKILAKIHQEAAAQTIAERASNERIDKLLDALPGGESPISEIKLSEKGGAAKIQFTQRWHNALTILRKLAKEIDGLHRPPWVDADVPNSIVQDQATEWFYHHEIRTTGESGEAIRRMHEQNKSSPTAAASLVLRQWAAAPEENNSRKFVNVWPRELHGLLSLASMNGMGAEGLARILFLAHSSRAHARQIRNSEFGLSKDTVNTEEERCRIFSKYLLSQSSNDGQGIFDLLRYVIWGDKQDEDVAARIWNATNSEKWKLRHVGPNILGELIGYARPDEFPPRNDRVAKTLDALGFQDVRS